MPGAVTERTTEKIAELAPIANPSVTMAVTKKPGDRRNDRAAYRASRRRLSIMAGYRTARPASVSTTYALTSRICSGVNALRNGGMLLRPWVTV